MEKCGREQNGRKNGVTPIPPFQIGALKQKPNILPCSHLEIGHSLEMFGIAIPLYRDG